jgi:MFS family permease
MTEISTKLQHSLESNIWKYTLLLIANKRIFVAILGAYYLTIPDVTPQIIGTILLIGNLAGFLFEIPSGYLSDKFGHKQALVLSRILMLFSTSFFIFADSVALLILGSIFLSASFSFLSGTGSAFMHETLQALNRDSEYAKVMGKASAIGFAVPIVLTVLVPFLITFSYKAPFIISLVIDVVGLWAVLNFTTPPVPPKTVEETNPTNFREVLSEGWNLNFFGLALFSGVVSGVLFSVGGFRAPYQIFLEVPVIWFGVLHGLGRIIASLILAYGGEIKKYFTLVTFQRFQLLAYTLLILVLGLSQNIWLIVGTFLLINGLQWGLSEIEKGFHLEIIKSSKFKATLLSVSAQIGQGISAVFVFAAGVMIEKFSYQYGFLSIAIILFMLLLPIYLYIARKDKKGAYRQI